MFKSSIRWFFLFFFILIVLTVIYFIISPNVSDLKRKNPSRTAFMKYREEEWKGKKEHHRIFQTWVSLSKISPYLIKAVLISEDDKFWKHEGFDYDSIEKAIGKDIQALSPSRRASQAPTFWVHFLEKVNRPILTLTDTGGPNASARAKAFAKLSAVR